MRHSMKWKTTDDMNTPNVTRHTQPKQTTRSLKELIPFCIEINITQPFVWFLYDSNSCVVKQYHTSHTLTAVSLLTNKVILYKSAESCQIKVQVFIATGGLYLFQR